MLAETNRDYHNCLVGNHYDSNMTKRFSSWGEFKEKHFGFTSQGFNDTYHFVFRYDIHRQGEKNYQLELCMMLQRKGIYTHLFIDNIDKNTLDDEVYKWLKERSQYLKDLWKEVLV